MLQCQRDAFSLPDDLHYLNCAYMAPLMRRVESAAVERLHALHDPTRIAPADFFEPLDRARTLFADLAGLADPGRVAVVPSVSYGIAVAARNAPVARGQNVVIAQRQFPSNVYAWKRVTRDACAELRVVPAVDEGAGRAREWTSRILESIDANTAVVALGTVDWTDGTPLDLAAVGERARSVGALYVLDGIQSIGARPFDGAHIQPDALICGAYKWLLGPMGIGLAYFGPRFDGGVPLEETWLGRRGSDDFQRLVDYDEAYDAGARRFDMGGRSSFILMAMLNAALSQLVEWSPASIQAYCGALVRELEPRVRQLGLGIDPADDRCEHLFAIRLARGADPAAVRAALASQRVMVSVRGAALRVAPHLYNRSDDLDALVDALRGAVR